MKQSCGLSIFLPESYMDQCSCKGVSVRLHILDPLQKVFVIIDLGL